MAVAQRKKIGDDLKVMLQKNTCSFTTDMWTEPHKSVPLLTVTAHQLDALWKSRATVLFTTEFDSEQKKQVYINIYIYTYTHTYNRLLAH